MTKTIPLQTKPKTFEIKVNPNLDMKLIFNINQFLRTVKKHFHYTGCFFYCVGTVKCYKIHCFNPFHKPFSGKNLK